MGARICGFSGPGAACHHRTKGRRTTITHAKLSLATLSTAALMASVAPVFAADVTYERLLNPEPQNWLMNHRDFGSQRYSPLDLINKSNVRNLKLAFAVPLGGKAGN